MPHTPGPWRVTEWPGVSGDTHFGIDAQKWRLAIVHSGNADDATLMAAAPEMLAALRVAHDALDYAQAQVDSENDAHRLRQWRVQIGRVLAKAEGRE